MNLLIGAVAFLLGSIPSAYLYAKLFGKHDIRQIGSGNVGAMNTARETGLLPGVLTLLTDFLKASAAVYLAAKFGDASYMPLLAAALVIGGHNYNPFLSFKGGKGLACLGGALVMIEPVILIYLLIPIVIFTLILKDTNTATGLSMLALPFLLYYITKPDTFYLLIGSFIALAILTKHFVDFNAYRKGRRRLF